MSLAPSWSCLPLRVSAAPPAAPKGAHKVPASWTSGQVGVAGAGVSAWLPALVLRERSPRLGRPHDQLLSASRPSCIGRSLRTQSRGLISSSKATAT